MFDKCTIYILGDICPRWGNSEQFNSGVALEVFHEVKQLIGSGDLVIANLEAPATGAVKKLSKNSMNLKAAPGDLALLADAGIHGVSLANNHILDYGIDGYKDTVENLEKNGMFCYGAGTCEECSQPVFRKIKGFTIGILAFAEQEFNCVVDYGIGANLWDDFDSIKAIHKAKKMCDYLIIQYHGGIEEYVYPSPFLQKKCRAMAEAGADLVTCQHSHCVGTRETWQNCEILYGQGNCIFGYSESDEGWNRGLIIKIQLDGKAEIEYIPIEAQPDGEHLMNVERAALFIGSLYKESEKLKDFDFIRQSWIQFCEEQKDSYLPMLFAHGRVLSKINRLTSGKIVSFITGRKARRNAMNLIRCDAHREVIRTVLELDYYGNKDKRI